MNWFKKILKLAQRAPRYPGQLQGDESRPSSSVLTDVIQDNELVEGKEVRILSKLVGEKNWDAFNNYVVELQREGHSKDRINSMITRAMHGIKL